MIVMSEPNVRSLCKKHWQRRDYETCSARGLLPERGNWEVSVWAPTSANWMEAALSSYLMTAGLGQEARLSTVYRRFRIPAKGNRKGNAGASPTGLPLLRFVGPKLRLYLIPNCGKTRVGAVGVPHEPPVKSCG